MSESENDRARAVLSALVLPDGETLGASGRLIGPSRAGARWAAAIRISAEEAGRFAAVRDEAEAALRDLPGGAGALVTLTAEGGASAPRPRRAQLQADAGGLARHGARLSEAPEAAPSGDNARSAPAPAPSGGNARLAPAPARSSGDVGTAQTPPSLPGRDRPADPPRLGANAISKPGSELGRVRHIVAVASGKGGVGKSTTSVNLALGLRALGLKVGLLDADIHGPSVPVLLGITQPPRVGADRRLIPAEAHGIAAMSIGLLVDPETAMIWRGPMVQSALNQMMHEVAWPALDVLIVDMPPGTGDAQLALAQGAPLSGAVIVSTPQDLALVDARRAAAMFRKTEVPILGVIENMAHFICPDCGGQHEIFGSGGARDEAARLGVPYLGAVPLTMALRAGSDQGRPVTALDPEGDLGQIYVNMARQLADALDTGAKARTQS
ncbi:MAG: P-loop NTPase [Paracoccus sp. (in: a-proteobacteria)]|nr:P-loop NTPase [Paracoccus sp. (in: a-proteobacteria)]